MHTWQTRLTSFFFYSLTMLMTLIAAVSISTWYTGENPPTVSKLEVSDVYRFHDGKIGEDRALFNFNLIADFTPVWDWHTHSIFIFLVCEYKTPSNLRNQIIVWDHIITDINQSNIHLLNQQIEYPLTSLDPDLRGKTIEFKLMWDIGNLNGVRLKKTGPSITFRMPLKYLWGNKQI